MPSPSDTATAKSANDHSPAAIEEQQQPNASVIAVTGSQDEERPKPSETLETLPILPLMGLVVFPGTVVPLTLGRPAALKLVDDCLPQTKVVGLITQSNEDADKPGPDDLFKVGVAAQVLKLMRQPDGTVVLLVQALRRIAVRGIAQTEPFLRAEVENLTSVAPPADDKEAQAAFNNLRESALQLMELMPDIPEQARMVLANIDDPGQLTDLLAGNLSMDTAHKQQLLEETDVAKRVALVQESISRQIEIAQLQQKLRKTVEGQFSDTQRRAYLREQIRAIQRELGETDSADDQIDQLRQRLEEAGPPEAVLQQAERELKRLASIPPASPEYSVIVTYTETLAELPWNKLSEDNLDLDQAQQILDRDHYDLEKIKRRLIEYLAVRKLNPGGRGPILCFLGPPGVGKTSLGQSIADALGRKFSRMSLGGIRDEAEIRGHRRTYIGSMPGRIIQDLRRLGTRNPVMMLDEVDKLGADVRGDPASALLEVLDPRQNNAFVDRYLDAPFDLSQVIFIATANYMEGIPIPLRDRMEVIQLPGYTEAEKLRIAQNYLVRRQWEENGLKPEQCPFEEEALRTIIGEYTHEAGVRDLERRIGAVCRSVAAGVAKGTTPDGVTITPDVARNILGANSRMVRAERLKVSTPGVVTGLAYTPTGGEVLFIEATRYPGRGGTMLTGQIGDVMKESMQAAYSLVRSRAEKLGIDPKMFQENDLHVHVPSGAIPKDGPSAGVAMFTAIASLFSNRRVRADVAMTGEITLRGLVLPIGGLKEKSLAALRAGISNVIVPRLNEKDLTDIPAEAREKLHFTLAGEADEVLEAALEKEPDAEQTSAS
jgi:ATP-dependent Lon protease